MCLPCDSSRCVPGITRTILGKEFKGLCVGGLHGGATAWFTNPDEVAIARVKRLLEWEQKARNE